MAVFCRVVIEQLGDDGVLTARLTEIIDGDILCQIPGDFLGTVTQGVESGFRKVKLGVFSRNRADNEVYQNRQNDNSDGDCR